MLQNAQIQLFIFRCDIHGWGYAEMTHPNPKSCSKCCKMPKSQLFIFGCDMLGWGYAENPPPQPENLDFQMSI